MPRSRTGNLTLRANGYHVRVTASVDGKTKRQWYALDTFDPKVAETKRVQLVEALAKGLAPSRREVAGPGNVEGFGTAWIKERRALGVVSARDEENNLKRYVYPVVLEDQRRFGEVKVTDVRPPQVRAVLMAAVAAGLSKGTVKHIRAALNRLFGAAWQNEIIPENPVLKAKLPKMRELKKERVVLTDEEIVQFVSSKKVDHELRVLSICARCEGGMRTGDVNAWDWTMIARPSFATCVVPRAKTEAPQEMAIPELLRPVLLSWWEQHGSPASGPVFPVRRGKTAGGFKAKRGTSYAERLRKGLFRAGVKRHICTRPTEARPPKVSEACCEALATDPLYSETAYTLPVDFHSFRRAYNSALAEAGVNLQHAMIFAGHSDARTHMRYVQRAAALRPVPEAALPDFKPGIATTRAFSPDTIVEKLARHTGFEPVAFGFGGRRSIQLS